MKKQDLIFILCVVACFMPFFLSDDVFNFYVGYNKAHGMITSFIKFAFLATLGEVIGLRMKTGAYNQKGFGILPRAIVWGFLGLTIKLAFVIFATGTPIFLGYLGLEGATDIMKGAFSSEKLLVAFAISACMNLIYAPVMMTLHKITDIHIVDNGGTVGGLLKPIQFSNIFQKLDWGYSGTLFSKKQFHFSGFRLILSLSYYLPIIKFFAAALGIVLGVLLAVASLKSAK